MYKTKQTVEYDGLIWHRYPNSTRRTDREYFVRGNRMLHRYIWEKFNGKIPKGCHIHHIDGNCSNNDISNLKCVTIKQHISQEHKLTIEQLQKCRQNLQQNALPKAIEWHKSEQAKQFHSDIGKKSWGNFVPTLKHCIVCGKQFYDRSRQQSGKFCCGACASKYARNVKTTKECEYCGKKFVTNKYYPARCCSRSCSAKMGHVGRKSSYNNLLE